MALTVPDNSYVSLADQETWATNHLVGAQKTAWDAASDATKEAALRNATEFIDGRFDGRWIGTHPGSSSQLRSWPRNNAYDSQGRSITGIPQLVKDATSRLASDLLDTSPEVSEDRGGRIKREKVDVLEVEYMDSAPSGKTYPYLNRILGPLLTSSGRLVRV